MTDSRGTAQHFRNKPNLSLLRQKEQTEHFRNFLVQCLVRKGIQTDTSYFDIMTQPKGTYDGLLYFSKIPVDSSDKILWKKIALDNHEYTPETPEESVYLHSLFEVRENGHPCWYVLQVNQILMERNLFDNEWIAVRSVSFPYYQLRRDWNTIAYKKGVNESPDSFGIIAGKNYADTEMLIQTAVQNDIINGQTEQILNFYQEKRLSGRDSDSNQKTYLLADLYEKQPTAAEVYHAFEITKIFLKRQTGEKAYLHYHGNNMVWTFRGVPVYIHICSQERYNIGGIFYDRKSLEELLHHVIYDKSGIPQKEWYQPLVPFLAEHNLTKKGKRL